MNHKFLRHLIRIIFIKMCMRRRRPKADIPAKDDYTPEIEEYDQAKEEPSTKPKAKKKTTNSKALKTKSRDADESQNMDDSQSSEILQIRNGDEVTRDHIRPPFLKRWDGISNELQLTEEEMDDLSPMLRVYWETKSKNMNAIIFLQFGRMQFFAFENDAIKLHEMTKKKLKRFSKFLMVNFWYKEIEDVKKELFRMKIPVLVMNQIEDRKYKEENGLIRRQVVEVITPALHLEQEDENPRSRLLLSVFHKLGKCAVVILDAQSNHFYVEELDDDPQFHEIRRIFNKYHPVELVIPNKQHKEIAQIARQICNPYINQCEIGSSSIGHQLNLFKAFNPSPLFSQLIELYKAEVQDQQSQNFSRFRVIFALTLVWRYLSSLSLLQKVFYEGLFHNLNEKISSNTNFFDSQVYQNLQIFRIKSQEEETYAMPGTLMGFLDHCQTKHGRKLLHHWIDQPLSNVGLIVQRQQAVKELLENSKILDAHNQLMKFQRLQKRLGDIYHWVNRNYQKGKTILTRYINPQKDYDIRKNPAVNKLKEIIEILKQIQNYEKFLKKLSASSPRSALLRKYVEIVEVQNIHIYSIEEVNKIEGIPEIGYVAQTILRRIDYNELTGHLQPMPGESEVFDEEKKEIDRIGGLLDDQLTKWKEYFKSEKISFVSVRAKNQIQIPKVAINKAKPNKELHFSSEIASSIRYTTHQTNVLSEEIMQHEKAIAQSYEPFLQDIVDQFCRFKFLWNIYIRSMSNLDVLMALAKAAEKMPTKCLPIFVPAGMKIVNGYHPNLLAVKEDIVANSIELRENEKVLLLTGPNMGGKSTFLKQVCSYAILAQIGSFIPANNYASIIYDQIFCRMGASDRIYEGKSTFYVELEETKRILTKATSSSLVVIDQLGRGTSTFDGMAIAQAILDSLMEKLGCMTIYSTHYTQITDKFKENEMVRMMKMGYSCEDQGRVNFSYQLMEGVAEKSFASNVGRMVGIPKDILKRAEIRSDKMHQEINRKKLMRQLCKRQKSQQFDQQQ